MTHGYLAVGGAEEESRWTLVGPGHNARSLRHPDERDGLTPEAVELLSGAEREYLVPIQFGADSWVFPLYLSAIHLARRSRDEGLEWLERADAAGFNGWNLIEQDPIFDVVRDDPRYRATIATMRERLEAQRLTIEREERAAGDRP